MVLPIGEGLFHRHLSLLHRTDAGWVVIDTIPATAWGSLAATSPGSDAMNLVLSLANGVETLGLSGGKGAEPSHALPGSGGAYSTVERRSA